MPSSSASAHAWSGPAPPNATSAKSRGSRPCSTETTRSARIISAFTTSITASGSRSPSARRGGRAVELDAAGKRRGQPTEEEVRVGHGRARRRHARSRPGRDRRPRSRGRRGARRPRPAARSSRRPRRPCARRASGGGREGRRPRARARAAPRRRRSRRRRSTCRPCRRRARSRSRRAPRCARRRRRPRPGRRGARTRRDAAASSSVASPPEERMTSGSGEAAPRARLGERAEVAGQHRARGTRPRRSSRRARTPGARARPRARRRRARRGGVGGAPRRARARASGPGTRRGGRPRSPPRRAPGASRESSGSSSPSGPDAPADADAALERDERRRVLGARPVEVRARLAAEVEEVLEAGVRDEGGARAAPLEERVRRDRGAVREAVEVGRADRGGGLDDGLLLPRRGRDLGGPHLAVRDEHGVGERPSDVDPEHAHGRIVDELPPARAE